MPVSFCVRPPTSALARNYLAGILALTFVAGAAVSAWADTKGHDNNRQLHFASYLPATHLTNIALRDFLDRVEADTDMPLEWKLHSGGLMGKAGDILTAVEDRVVDAGVVVDAYTPWALRNSMMLSSLSLLGSDALSMTAAVNEMQLLRCRHCRRDFLRLDVEPLAFYATAPYRLLCNKAVRTVDDIRGTKIRGTGATARTLRYLGATPVNIPSSEIFEALQRGQIDCVAGSLAWLKAYSLADVTHFILDIPLGTYHGVNVFNLNLTTLAGLDDQAREVLVGHIPRLLRDIVVAYRHEETLAVAAARESGIEFGIPEQALLDRVEAYRQREFDGALEYAGRHEIEDARETLEEFVATVNKWDRLLAAEESPVDAYERLLAEHVFAPIELPRSAE